MTSEAPSERTRLRRVHDRGHYDKETIHAILDAGLLCHVGYVIDGAPYVTPTLHWREGDHVYWHGSSASRMLRHQGAGAEVCLTVSHLDGLVVARSGFHHSINYRSAMLFGTAHKVAGADKEARLKTFLEHVFPGRWDAIRPITDQELKATTVLGMAIDEASAKVRTGPPVDDEEDYALPIWAGVVPIRTVIGEPEPDDRVLDGVAAPDHLKHFVFG
jgi:nitroimidazol reductase NimA-like FMN-containing flavoprotein (pyridoxamine 5'-phosphate oxidase superfamily)